MFVTWIVALLCDWTIDHIHCAVHNTLAHTTSSLQPDNQHNNAEEQLHQVAVAVSADAGEA
jgi:hypothetical protein